MPGKRKSDELKTLIVEAKLRGETDRDVADRFSFAPTLLLATV